MPLTREQRDKWVARLRDPASKQHRFAGAYAAHYDRLNGHEAMCCLVHGTFILGLDSSEYYSEMINLIERDAVARLECMNDKEEKSLPQIADWIEANIPISD